MIVGRNKIDFGFGTPTIFVGQDEYKPKKPEITLSGFIKETLSTIPIVHMLNKNDPSVLNNINTALIDPNSEERKKTKAAWSYLRRNHELINAYSFIKNTVRPLLNSITDDEPFKISVEDVEDYDMEYWPYLAESTSKSELNSRQSKLNREFNDIKLIDTLGSFEKLVLGAATIATSPTTYLTGSLTAFRGATKGITALGSAINVAKNVAPKVALSSALTNVPSYLNRPTISGQEYALNAFMNGVISGALYGLGGAIQHKVQANIRVGMVADSKNPTVHNVFDGKTGEMTGIKVTFTNGPKPNTTNMPTVHTPSTNTPATTTPSTIDDLPLTPPEIKKEASKLATGLLQEHSDLSNLTNEQIIKLNEQQIESYYSNSINNIGDGFLKTFKFVGLPVVKGFTSQFPIVKDFTSQLFGSSNFIISNMAHPDLQEIEKKIFAVKHALNNATLPEVKTKLKQALSILNTDRKNIIKTIDSQGHIYSGNPANEQSAQTEAASWVNNFNFLMLEARKIWFDHVGLGKGESNLPFVETYAKLKQFVSKVNNGKATNTQSTEAAIRKMHQSGDFSGLRKLYEDMAIEPADVILDWESLCQQASYALRRHQQSKIPAAAEIAKLFREKIMDPLLKEAQELDLLPIYTDGRSYLTRIPNQEKLTEDRKTIVEKIEVYAKELNNKIQTILQPLETNANEIKTTKKEIVDEDALGVKKDKIKLYSLKNRLQYLQKEKIKLEEELQRKADTGTFELSDYEVKNYGLTQEALIDPRFTLTVDQLKEYEELTKDLTTARNDLKALKETAFKDEMEMLRYEIEKEANANKIELSEAVKELKQKAKEEIKVEQEELKKQIKLHKEEIQRQIKAGNVSKELLYTNDITQETKLRNIKKELLTRIAKPIKNPKLYADNIVDTWKGYNEQQMAGEMFDSLKRGGGKPNSLKPRTVLCTDYYIEDFLSNDLQIVVGSYVGALSNYIALEKLFRKFGEKLGVKGKVTAANGEEFIVKELKKSYELKRKEITDRPKPPERSKELSYAKARKEELMALEKDFKDYITFIKESIQIFRGNYGTPTTDSGHRMSEYANNLTRYATATMLGGTALMAAGDMIMPMFKHGVFPHIIDGLIPMFGSLLTHPLTATDAFKDARVGTGMALASMRSRVFGEVSQYHYRSSRKASLVFENIAKSSMNAFLLAPIIDFTETAAAFTASARLIRAIDKYYKEGQMVKDANGNEKWVSSAKFSVKDLEWLQSTRLDLNKWGRRIQEMLKKHKEPRWTGHIPHEDKWEDMAAAQQFRMFLTNEVDQSQNRVRMGDKPYWTKSPIGRIITQFYTWGFSATNNLTIPALQRMDKEKFTWIFLSLAAGAIVGPLRDLAEGRTPDFSPEKLWIEAMTQSGLFGYQFDLIIKLNALLGSPLGSSPDRYGHRKFSSMALGSGGAILDRAFELVGSVARGELDNEKIRRGVRMIPPLNAAYLRRPINHLLDTMPD